MSKAIKVILTGLMVTGLMVGVTACHVQWDDPSSAPRLCAAVEENITPQAITVGARLGGFRTGEGAYAQCQFAVPEHDHLHCANVDYDSHAIWNHVREGNLGCPWF